MPVQMRMLYKCTWDDGKTVSFVLARSTQDAIDILEELGGADASMLDVVDHRANFFVTFRACYETKKHTHGATECDIDEPHWHASDLTSEELWELLGDPPPLALEPPPADEDDGEPPCVKCGAARFASMHHPAYTKPNRCEYEAPAQTEPAEPAEAGPDRPTSE